MLIVLWIIEAALNLKFTDITNKNKAILILQFIRSFSLAFALTSLIILGWYSSKLRQMYGLNIFKKLLIVKLGILFTEVQPLLIEIFAGTDLIASTSKYSTGKITVYTHSLLICTEMILWAFCLCFCSLWVTMKNTQQIKRKDAWLTQTTTINKWLNW